MGKGAPGRASAKPARSASTTKAAATAIDEVPRAAPITASERKFLERVMKLLVGIQSPDVLRRARREGYSDAEHREGWRLLKLAAGENRSLDHAFAEIAAEAEATPSLGLLQQLDDFENTWFPRTRAIIRRVVPAEHREKFEAAFFHQLAQQPLGPAVVESVRTFVNRVEGLEKSQQPGAAKVRETLSSRGLDARRVAHIKDLLAQVEEGRAERPSGVRIDPKAVARAQAEQREAFEALRAWFHDWATTLRPLFGLREQYALGLTLPKRAGAAGDEEDEGGEDEDQDEQGRPAPTPQPAGERPRR